MSKYTTEVRYICEQYAGLEESVGYSHVNEVIADSREQIFDFEYPIFDENYRSVLESKILKHYYTREIGEETVGLWKLRLDARMNEIMPYYNKLYESELLQFNPLYDADYYKAHAGSGEDSETRDTSTSGTENVDGTGSGATIASGTNNENGLRWDKYSDTPQGSVTDLDSDTYLTNARKITDAIQRTNSSNEQTSRTTTEERSVERNENVERNLNTTDQYLDHIFGKMPGRSYVSLITELRDSFLNIDFMIIDKLGDLFMNIW